MQNTTFSLEGRHVVIVGGATGIGFAIAELASELGARITLGSTNEGRLKAAAAQLEGASICTVNLRDEDSVKGFFDFAGGFDHLAITAGDWSPSTFMPAKDIDLTQARDLFTVRFWGALAAVQQGCKAISPDGSITLTSGLLSERPMKGGPLVTAVAGAVEHLAKGLAMDLAPLRINVVSPSLILTETVLGMPEAARQQRVAPYPLRRAGNPKEAAKAYVYLMLNSYVTGQVLSADGGALLV